MVNCHHLKGFDLINAFRMLFNLSSEILQFLQLNYQSSLFCLLLNATINIAELVAGHSKRISVANRNTFFSSFVDHDSHTLCSL